MSEPYSQYSPAPQADQYQNGQYQNGQPTAPPRGGLATASLVLGILALVAGVIPVVNFVAYPLALLAIVFGILAVKWGRAKAGLILGILGLIATILWTVAFVGLFHTAQNCSDRTTNAAIQQCLRNN